jgi:hypothetical protein
VIGIEILLSTGFPFNVAGFHAGIFSIKRLDSLSKGAPRELQPEFAPAFLRY